METQSNLKTSFRFYEFTQETEDLLSHIEDDRVTYILFGKQQNDGLSKTINDTTDDSLK